jgi:hypothetical protein
MYIENVFEELDVGGEFFFDSSQSLLYVLPNMSISQLETATLAIPVLYGMGKEVGVGYRYVWYFLIVCTAVGTSLMGPKILKELAPSHGEETSALLPASATNLARVSRIWATRSFSFNQRLSSSARTS